MTLVGEMPDRNTLLIKVIKEAIFFRETEITYDEKHPGIHDSLTILQYKAELEELRVMLKEYS